MSDAINGVVPSQVTPEFLQAVNAAAIKAGLAIPQPEGGVPDAPTQRLEWGWRRLGFELGGILRSRNIFLKAGELGRVNERTAQWEVFTPHNFAGWVEEFCAFTWKGEKTPLIAEHCRMLMAQFTFLEQIRELEGVHTMSLPVLRGDGSAAWLTPGYDAQSKIFTVELLKYDHEWPVLRGRDYLRDWCKDFPWMRADGEEGRALEVNRSFSAHVMAMLGIYCRAMSPAGVTRPMFFYNANQPGSGKSTAAQMAFVPVAGLTAANDMPKNDDEMTKELAAAAQAFVPFLFLDDVGGLLYSTKLNRFITSPRHSGRVLGTPRRFDVPAVTQVFATGNNVTGSRDLSDRAIIIEMFYPGDLKARKFDRFITPHSMATNAVRCDFLSAMCALVKHWAAATPAERESLDGIAPHPRFIEWSKLLAGIVMFAGYSNPLAPPIMAFDEAEDEVKLLFIAAATAEMTDRVFTRETLVALAREKELMEDVVGTSSDKDLDAKANKRFGLRLKACRGLVMMDANGRQFSIGKGRKRLGATYPLSFA